METSTAVPTKAEKTKRAFDFVIKQLHNTDQSSAHAISDALIDIYIHNQKSPDCLRLLLRELHEMETWARLCSVKLAEEAR